MEIMKNKSVKSIALDELDQVSGGTAGLVEDIKEADQMESESIKSPFDVYEDKSEWDPHRVRKDNERRR